ncbi:hypothetical protein [Rhizobium mongolense]|uniref:Polyketide cyclase/dehydrase/lipid transport protein n=2 Tax=Rhizobium mongolense TaxID=57676 RepID=A0ABR6IW77_9HYPH|nr:hypothetical protein [Rhizobium mongolense]MBB4232169.1 hypothetical protein [Rhizobium mongolense]TVZ63110.1 hypothetical protein BCL32_3227 [Rhizobium mongolense USDA 1844]
MEALAYQVLQIGELGSLMLSWVIMLAAAAAGVALIKPEFRLGRPMYFLTMGLSFLLSGATSLFVLGVQDAMKNNYLAVIVALIYGSLIPIGVFAGTCAAARSKDAYGTHAKWVLAFIPLANLLLLFAPTQEKTKSGVGRIARNIVLVVSALAMMGVGRGLGSLVERQVTSTAQVAQNDPQLQSKALQYEVQVNGLEASLNEAAKAIRVPTKLDSITTLKAVEVENDTFRYVYEISDTSAKFTSAWRDIMTNKWCRSENFKLMIEIGATVEGKYVSLAGEPLAGLKVNTALCDQWQAKFRKTMKDAASAVKVPSKLDDVTTLTAADYEDGIFSYYYTVSVTPPDNSWKDFVQQNWCKTDQLKPMMDLGLDIRGVYATEAKAPVGEVLINTAICGAIKP